ncbi:protein NRT1/ PTR FAMILY 2.7-like isoform X2 [Populus alba x Populus x berolinensis]|nr:protein NRT1/ PTR FAMILY 2.7-like isoform X2 [Populus alba x Populus x berolinensis]
MGADQFDKPNNQVTFFTPPSSSIFRTVLARVWDLTFVSLQINATGLAVDLADSSIYNPFLETPNTDSSPINLAMVQEDIDTLPAPTKQAIPSTHNRVPHLIPFEIHTLRFEDDRKSDGSYSSSWWLCTVEEVEDLKTLIKIMPLWSSGILLSTTIAMINSLTVLQALTMDRHLGPHFKIPAGSFLVFSILATAISISIIDRFLLPIWEKLTRRSLKPLQQIGIGHVINIFAMVGSALVETRRLRVVRTHHLNREPPGSVVPMSGLWLMVQFIVIGVGEAFHFPGQVALYYQEFPKSLRSTSTAMISLLIGMGYYPSTAIIDSVRRSTGWLPDNINDGRLDYFNGSG